MEHANAMTRFAVGEVWLECRLLLQRVSAPAYFAVVLGALSSLGYLAVLPMLKSKSARIQEHIQQITQQEVGGQRKTELLNPSRGESGSATAGPSSDGSSTERLAAWRARLGDFKEVHEVLSRLFSTADHYELKIERVEYEQTVDSSSGLVLYRVRFEMLAPYAVLRRYCDEVLRRFAFISLDEFKLEREAVTTDSLRSKVGFALHLRRDGP
jgi:hypothetical protein